MGGSGDSRGCFGALGTDYPGLPGLRVQAIPGALSSTSWLFLAFPGSSLLRLVPQSNAWVAFEWAGWLLDIEVGVVVGKLHFIWKDVARIQPPLRGRPEKSETRDPQRTPETPRPGKPNPKELKDTKLQ